MLFCIDFENVPSKRNKSNVGNTPHSTQNRQIESKNKKTAESSRIHKNHYSNSLSISEVSEGEGVVK